MRRAAAVALAGAALLLAAFTFDSSTLFVPAVALLVLPVVVKVWIWLTWRVASVERDLEAERVIEDEPVEARIELRGRLGMGRAVVREACVPLALERLASGDRLAAVLERGGRHVERGLERPAVAFLGQTDLLLAQG